MTGTKQPPKNPWKNPNLLLKPLIFLGTWNRIILKCVVLGFKVWMEGRLHNFLGSKCPVDGSWLIFLNLLGERSFFSGPENKTFRNHITACPSIFREYSEQPLILFQIFVPKPVWHETPFLLLCSYCPAGESAKFSSWVFETLRSWAILVGHLILSSTKCAQKPVTNQVIISLMWVLTPVAHLSSHW